MMRFAMIGGLAVTALLSFCGAAAPAHAAGHTREELVKFIESAAEFVRTHPHDEAFAEISNPKGRFTFGDLYVFAFDFDGKCLANGERPAMIGKNVMGIKDRTGYPVVQNLVNAAKPGKGFVEYMWDNPATHQYERKLTYVLKVDAGTFVGGGIYLGPASPSQFKR